MPLQSRHPGPADGSIAALLAYARQQLATMDSPRLDSELLLAHVLQRSRTYLYTHTDQILDARQMRTYLNLIRRRVALEPVAYLTGIREFWSLPLSVTAATLIPRPETEQLVELALAQTADSPNLRLADLGTGSGAIAIALASELAYACIVATDNSEAVFEAARANADRHCPGRIDFRHGDWFEPLANERFDMIISNPPYVEAGDPVLQATELQYEPRSALDGGSDGLNALRTLIDNAGRYLQPNGRLLLEHGARQAPMVRGLLKNAGYGAIDTCDDTAGLARITMAKWPD